MVRIRSLETPDFNDMKADELEKKFQEVVRWRWRMKKGHHSLRDGCSDVVWSYIDDLIEIARTWSGRNGNKEDR